MAMSQSLVQNSVMVGEEVVISDSLVTHFARPVGVEVVGDPIDSTSDLGGEEGLACGCSH